MMAEYFDICDEYGSPTGETIERSEAHRSGILHRTAHIWIVREKDGRHQVLLQQRSFHKDSFPGLFDTSSAGHILAGDEPAVSAQRELAEELGIRTETEHLRFAGNFRICYEETFYDEPFIDNEVVFVYVYDQPVNIEDVRIQEEELECVRWFDLEEVYDAVLKGREDICVTMKGLCVLMRFLGVKYERKLIASDYDGSIRYLDDVTEEDAEALRKWQEEGNLFVIDTGRSMESFTEQAEKYGLSPDYYIANNGGMVYDSHMKMMFSSYIDRVMALDIMYIAKEAGNVVSYVVNDGWHRHRIIVDDSLEEKRYPELIPDISEEDLMNLGTYAQIVISMRTPEEGARLAQRINAHFPELVEVYSNKYAVDVVPAGISKAGGLSFLVDHLQMSEEQVWTFGDADNDIPLLEFGIHGCCISSADEAVKAHAKYTAGSVSDLIRMIRNEQNEDA